LASGELHSVEFVPTAWLKIWFVLP